MGLVKYALKFRVTFYVLSVLILFLGIGSIIRMPKDVFPSVDIPVVSVIWTYTGLTTPEMAKRVTTYSEYSLSNNINGIRNIESQTLYGVSVIKVYFQPDVNLDLAIAQIVASVNWIRAIMPPGIQAPTVIRYSASAVPVIQLALSSDKQSEQQLFDYGLYRVRQALTQVPGATLPVPAGGKLRQIMVDLDLHALQVGRADTNGYHQRGHRRERRGPLRPREAGQHAVSGAAQFLARCGRGVEPDSGEGRQRHAGAAARRSLCARRVSPCSRMSSVPTGDARCSQTF